MLTTLYIQLLDLKKYESFVIIDYTRDAASLTVFSGTKTHSPPVFGRTVQELEMRVGRCEIDEFFRLMLARRT